MLLCISKVVGMSSEQHLFTNITQAKRYSLKRYYVCLTDLANRSKYAQLTFQSTFYFTFITQVSYFDGHKPMTIGMTSSNLSSEPLRKGHVPKIQWTTLILSCQKTSYLASSKINEILHAILNTILIFSSLVFFLQPYSLYSRLLHLFHIKVNHKWESLYLNTDFPNFLPLSLVFSINYPFCILDFSI